MNTSKQLKATISWRIVTELWRRFPDEFLLLETHPGGGQYDCLSFYLRQNCHQSVLQINRGGSLHVRLGNDVESYPDWCERMLIDPVTYLDEITRSIGYEVPSPLPSSTPATLAFRYISEILTHTIGRREHWECRNGFLDSSGWEGGKREDWFALFPTTESETAAQLPERSLDPAYAYWFLLKNGDPVLCLDTDGRLHQQDHSMCDLSALYSRTHKIWPLIAETALEELP